MNDTTPAVPTVLSSPQPDAPNHPVASQDPPDENNIPDTNPPSPADPSTNLLGETSTGDSSTFLESPAPSEKNPENNTPDDHASGGHADTAQAPLKIVISIHTNSAVIGIARHNTDPYIQAFNFADVDLLLEEIPAIMQAAIAQWKVQPLYPEYAQPDGTPAGPPRTVPRITPSPQGPTNQGTLSLF